ncbi:MAG: protein kinase [Labilithrix sp.]|nr:protein kinase [Labilithrix sp.]MCW5810865.1 protein kinase [Labilithrix sp.]
MSLSQSNHGSVRAGEVIAGRYRVESVLGDGGHGVVVGAVDVRGGERVAVKMLHATTEAEPTLVARFLREGEAASRLRSEHVARVIDAGTSADGRPYLVTELLEGEDLARVIASSDVLDVGQAVDLVLQTCAGLVEAHGAGIVHRDLKPANLFLTSGADGRPLVKVLDFGVCKIASADALTKPSELIGTPRYMSPEQLAGREADARADIWALGVILYELVTKQSPFEGERLSAIMNAVLTQEPPSLHDLRPGVPAELSRIARRCLAKRPDERFASVTDLASALAPFGLTPARRSPEGRRRAEPGAPGTLASPGGRAPERSPPPRVEPTLASPGLRSSRQQAESVTNELAIATPPRRSAGARDSSNHADAGRGASVRDSANHAGASSSDVESGTLVSASDEAVVATAPARESSPASVMRRFGKYVMYAPLASGGMASVYYGAMEEEDGSLRPVALKRVRAELTDANFAAMLSDEARIAGRVRHANVVATLDVIVSDGESMLALEYVPGVSLGELLRTLRARNVKAPPAIASVIVAQVLAGLHAAHEAVDLTGQPLDIVHRDVSPANVLLHERGVAKVADFGVAYARGRLQKTTETGAMKGKLAYLSPEQVHGEATRASDVYAVGVVLWEMLVGRPMFQGSEGEILAAVLLGKIKPPSTQGRPDVRALDAVVMTALEHDAGRRYADAQQMIDALAAAAPPATQEELAAFIEAQMHDSLVRRRSEIGTMLEAIARSNIFAEGAPVTLPLDPPAHASGSAPAHASGPGLAHASGPSPAHASGAGLAHALGPAHARPSVAPDARESGPVFVPPLVPARVADASARSRGRVSAVIGAGVALFFLGSAAAVWATMRPARPVTAPPPSVAATEPSVAVPPPSGATPEPSAESPGPDIDDAPDEPPIAASPTASMSASADHKAPRGRPRKNTKGCTPPYYINEEGRTIWKRECFRK